MSKTLYAHHLCVTQPPAGFIFLPAYHYPKDIHNLCPSVLCNLREVYSPLSQSKRRLPERGWG